MRSGRQKPNYEKVCGKDFIKSFEEEPYVKQRGIYHPCFYF